MESGAAVGHNSPARVARVTDWKEAVIEAACLHAGFRLQRLQQATWNDDERVTFLAAQGTSAPAHLSHPVKYILF